jgi:chromosome partitioning protein
VVRQLKDVFDFVIIDTSPVFGALDESCLLASDEIVVVLGLDEFSTDGLVTFHQNIESLRDRYDTEKPLMNKIVLNGRDLRLSQQNDYLSKMNSIASQTEMKLFIVPVDQSFKKAQSIHFPIQFLTDTKKETLEIIQKIANDIAKK